MNQTTLTLTFCNSEYIVTSSQALPSFHSLRFFLQATETERSLTIRLDVMHHQHTSSNTVKGVVWFETTWPCCRMEVVSPNMWDTYYAWIPPYFVQNGLDNWIVKIMWLGSQYVKPIQHYCCHNIIILCLLS